MSIHKTKAKTFQVRWRVSGKLKARNFNRKIDAQQFEASLRLDWDPKAVREAIPEPASITTFSEFADIWLRDYASVHKTEGSVKYDKQTLRDYLNPVWGRKSLSEITRRDIAKLQGKLSAEGKLRPKTINNIVGLAHTIFNIAVEWEFMNSNPARGLHQIKVPEQDYRFWTFEERDRFLCWAKTNDPELHDIIATAVYTGLRRGEMEALRRDCIDLERRFIIVKRSFCSKTCKVNEYTKGKKIRRVPMNEVVFKIMQHRAFLPMDRMVLEAEYGHIVYEWFGPAELEAKVSRITFHDLRHTFASHLAMSGVSPFDIQKLMGHSDIKTTMRYLHLAPDHLSGLTDVLLGKERRIQNSSNERLEPNAR